MAENLRRDVQDCIDLVETVGSRIERLRIRLERLLRNVSDD